jgi:ligand-binding sensor domain-containing protein
MSCRHSSDPSNARAGISGGITLQVQLDMRGRFARLVVSATLALFSTFAFALDPTEQLSELNHTAWTAREGAPTNVSVIAQTNDGSLWLGCTTGLFHFDGARFERLTLADGTQPITADVTAVQLGPTGTSVELLVPGERAYRESSRGPVWLQRFMRSGLLRMTRAHH